MKNKSTLYKILGAIGGIMVLAALLVALQLTYSTTNTVGSVADQMVKSTSGAPAMEESLRMEEPAPVMGDAEAGSNIGIPTPPPTAGETAGTAPQRIIKTGFLDLIVNNVNDTVQNIESLINEMEGFVQSSSVSERGDGTHEGSMTVRVPVDQMESAMEEIKRLANLVETERVTGQDVTEQYTDLEARLNNAQSQEERYRELLDQAEDVEDILAIERELNQIRNEIEYLQGRLQSLENQTTYSTINITLAEEPRVQGPTKEFRPFSSVNEAAQSLVQLGQQFVIGLIWVVIVGGGIAIPLAILGWVVYKIVKSLKHRNE